MKNTWNCCASATLFLIVALAGSLSGCSTSSGADIDPGVEKNLEAWTLPSDRYIPPSYGQLYEAQFLLANDCLAEKGADQLPVPVYDMSAPAAATSNAAGRKLFNEEIASQFGYREQPDPRTDWATRDLIDNSDFWAVPANSAAWNECLPAANKAIGRDMSEPDVFGFGQVESTSAIETANAAWRECMAPMGIPSITAEVSPANFPTPDLMCDAWGVCNDAGPSEPSADEIRVAVADAKCRESSGWSQVVYEAQWDAEIEYLHENYKELESLRAQHEEQTKRIQQVIEEHH